MKPVVAWIAEQIWPLLPAIVGPVAVAVLAAGCGSWAGQTPWPVKSVVHAKGSRVNRQRPVNAATWVENALHAKGVKFGTDGSVEALYAYASGRHRKVDPREARLGDLVFFDTTLRGNNCGAHVGVLTGITPGGALKFSEWRDGVQRESFVDPMRPQRRRDEQGRVINSFLRARQPRDPSSTRYYAGEMLCAVIRVR